MQIRKERCMNYKTKTTKKNIYGMYHEELINEEYK